MSRTITYDSQGNDITCMKEFDALKYPCRECDRTDCEERKSMRKPKVENKYNLKPKDIQKAIIIDYERLKQHPFWRNDVVQAWCLSDGSGRGCYGGHMDSYWIGFYDKDAKAYASKIRLSCSSYEDMCNYNFKKFFDYSEIENEVDLELQEKLLSRINWLIDEEIIEIPKE